MYDTIKQNKEIAKIKSQPMALGKTDNQTNPINSVDDTVAGVPKTSNGVVVRPYNVRYSGRGVSQEEVKMGFHPHAPKKGFMGYISQRY